MIHKLLTTIIILITSISFTFAQGIIKGQLKDVLSNEAIIGANILIDGLKLGSSTDIEGNFIINNVPVGKYTITVTSIGYESKKISNISIENDKITLINSAIIPDIKELGEVVVKGSRRTNTEIAIISQIKEAKQVVSGISAEQILKSQDRDAAEVVRRIPGVTVIDNRFINIRGLNERYNTVWLNDAIAPSSETDRKSFSFDIIPSNLLDRVLIFKTPSPELPGDFAGGMVKVYTRKPSYTEESLNFNVGTGYRSGTTFNDFTSDKASSLDGIGLGYNDRKLPTATPDANGYISNAQAKTFNNTYDLSKTSASPDLRANLSYLRGFKLAIVLLEVYQL